MPWLFLSMGQQNMFVRLCKSKTDDLICLTVCLLQSKGLKMCDFQFHGAHDHFALLKRALDLSSKRMLPLNVEQLDLQGMSMHLLGMDLDVELSTTAHWEKEILDDEMVSSTDEYYCGHMLIVDVVLSLHCAD